MPDSPGLYGRVNQGACYSAAARTGVWPNTSAAWRATAVPLKKSGVLSAQQPHRIGECEVAEVGGSDQPVLYQLVGFRQDHPHVGHVEMADIGAEDRIDPGAERVDVAECHGIHPVVGLAAEIERPGIEVDPVLLAGDFARGVVVVLRDPAVELVVPRVRPAVAAAQL